MRFLKAAIESFCSIGKAEYQLSDQGLVVVRGENRDAESAGSNGSGKSSLVVDAICWVLFGRTTKGGTADSVTPGGKGKGTAVTIEFTIGEKLYRVSRYRKHKEFANKLLISCDGADLTKSTSDESDKLLEQIIGISYDTFLYTTILGQGMMFRFSQLTDTGRKEILEGIAGCAIYDTARVAARDEAKGHQARIDALKGNQERSRVRLEGLQRQLASALDTIAKADADFDAKQNAIQAEITQTQAQLEVADEAIRQLGPEPDQTVLDTLRRVEQLALSAMMAAGGTASEAKARLKTATQSLEALARIGPTCDKCARPMTAEHYGTEHASRSAAVAAAQADVDATQIKSAEAYGKHKQIQDQISGIQEAERAYNRRKNDAAHYRNGILGRLDSLKRSAARIMKQDLSSLRDAAQANIDTETRAIAATEKEITDLTAQQKAAEFWVSGFQEIRVAAVDGLLAFLNERLAVYCNIMCGSDILATLQHTDKGKIEMTVATTGGTYNSLSGGEKDRLDICLAMALHALASQTTNWTSNILVLDEVGVFLDAAGVDRFMRLVAEKMDTGHIESCFIVSHNPVFEGYGDRVMTVVKEGGVSRLE